MEIRRTKEEIRTEQTLQAIPPARTSDVGSTGVLMSCTALVILLTSFLASGQQRRRADVPRIGGARPGRRGYVLTSSLASSSDTLAPPQPSNSSDVPPRIQQERHGSSATGQ